MNSASVACVLGGATFLLGVCGETTSSATTCHIPYSYNDFSAWNALPGMCGHADDQSPINIVSADVAADPSLPDMVFNLIEPTIFTTLTYDMKTWQINVPPGAASVAFQGKTFDSVQFHFHSPSEHTIDGVHGAMEGHFVNTGADGQILVVAVIFDIGEESPLLSRLEYVATPHLGDGVNITLPNPYHFTLGMTDQSYLHYTGSLTTPPCTNGTEWIIMRERFTLAPAQLTSFRQRMNDPACNMLAVHEHEYPEGIPHNDWDASLGVNNRQTKPLGARAVHSHAYSAPSSQAAPSPPPAAAILSDALVAQQLGDSERPSRPLSAALSCVALFSVAMGAVFFLRRRARAGPGQDEQLPSHFVEITD